MRVIPFWLCLLLVPHLAVAHIAALELSRAARVVRAQRVDAVVAMRTSRPDGYGFANPCFAWPRPFRRCSLS